MFKFFCVLVCFLFAASAALSKTSAESKLFLYISPTTHDYFLSQNETYELSVKRWRTHLRKFGKQAHTIGREQLVGGVLLGTLILPNSVALAADEREAIKLFVSRGGNLLGSGLVGSRDSSGNYVGLDFLQSIFHVEANGFFQETSDSFFMPYGDGPVTWPVPAGRRMPLLSAKDSVLRLKSDNLASVVMDWSRTMDLQPNGVMAFNEIGLSRLVYFSFPDTAWPYNRDVQLVMDASLAWLRREPIAYKAAWPDGYVASHLIEMDTEDKFATAVRLAELLEGEGFRGTFYCLTSEAVREPKTVHNLLARGHEIAYHADVHFGFNGDPGGEQELRIAFMIQQMQSIIGERSKEATGFRAPTESYDATTESLLHKYGIKHHAADLSSSADRLPFFSDPGGGRLNFSQSLVVLPRTQRDDIEFQKLQFNADAILANLLYDLNHTVNSGAFGLLSVHSQYFVDGGFMLSPMRSYVKRVSDFRDRLWVARGDEIANWWRRREVVTIKQKKRESTLTILVDSPISVPGLSVFVTVPRKNAVMRIVDISNTSSVRVKKIDSFRSVLIFDKHKEGKTVLSLVFDDGR
ncbi:MAG: polysaccharide deacetylase family protein [Hydrogenophaga sp.]|nr:polysaccharide deacetylase family protein [Hydrogenophaga sp.]